MLWKQQMNLPNHTVCSNIESWIQFVNRQICSSLTENTPADAGLLSVWDRSKMLVHKNHMKVAWRIWQHSRFCALFWNGGCRSTGDKVLLGVNTHFVFHGAQTLILTRCLHRPQSIFSSATSWVKCHKYGSSPYLFPLESGTWKTRCNLNPPWRNAVLSLSSNRRAWLYFQSWMLPIILIGTKLRRLMIRRSHVCKR